MIEIRDLSFTYENSGENVLKDFNLTISEGEFVCIIGHSGCGKSTLIHLLAGLEKPTRGSIRIDGQRMEGPGTDRAVVFQNYTLFPWMTVRKNIIFAAMKTGRFSKEEAGRRADMFLHKTGMSVHEKKYPFQLSGGMRQRAAIAKALAMDSEIFLFDEPFGALDPQNRKELQQLLQKLCREQTKTVVFVTHDLDEALTLGQRILFIKDGTIAKDLDITERINDCCAHALKYEDCQTLKKSLEAWFQ